MCVSSIHFILSKQRPNNYCEWRPIATINEFLIQNSYTNAYIARDTMHILTPAFQDNLISVFSDIHWRQHHRTYPSQTFVSHVVSLMQNPEPLEQRIRQEMQNLSPEMLQKHIENAAHSGGPKESEETHPRFGLSNTSCDSLLKRTYCWLKTRNQRLSTLD